VGSLKNAVPVNGEKLGLVGSNFGKRRSRKKKKHGKGVLKRERIG